MFAVLSAALGAFGKKSALFIGLVSAACCLGMTVYPLALAKRNAPYEQLSSGYCTLQATAASSSRADLHSNAVSCRVTAVNGEEVRPVRIWLKTDRVREIACGQQLYAVGELLLSENSSGTLEAVLECAEVTVSGSAHPRMIDSLRLRIRENLRRAVGDDVLCQVLLLGGSGGLESSFRQSVSAVGISHYFAVSGMHLSYLIDGLTVLLHGLRAGRKWIGILTCTTVLIFAALCGFTPSVVRAAVMWLLLQISQALRRESRPLLTLLWALTFICLCDPLAVSSPSLQLSFAAMLGIVCFLPELMLSSPADSPGHRSCFFGPLVLNLVAMTAAAQVFAQPLALLLFGSVSWVAPLSCLVFSLPVTLLFWLTGLTALLGLFSVPAGLLGTLCARLSSAFRQGVVWAAPWSAAAWQPPAWTAPLLLAVNVAVVLAVLRIRRRVWRVPALSACLIAESAVMFLI